MRGLARNFTRTGTLVVLATVALSGCQSGTEPTVVQAPSATSPPVSSAPATDPLRTVIALSVGPEALELRDDSGATVLALSYEGPADGAVGALTIALGADPVVEEFAAELESPATTEYQWDGFALVDFRPAEGAFTHSPNFSVRASAPSSGAASLETAGGFRVGDDLRAAAAALGMNVDTTFESLGSIFYLELGPELDTPPGENTGAPNALAVLVSSQEESGAIDRILSYGNASFHLQ